MLFNLYKNQDGILKGLIGFRLAMNNEMDYVVNFIPPKIENYTRFMNLTQTIAKKHVPRGFRQTYIFQVGM